MEKHRPMMLHARNESSSAGELSSKSGNDSGEAGELSSKSGNEREARVIIRVLVTKA